MISTTNLRGPLLDPSWLQILRGEIGVHEITGAPAHPRIVEYHRSTSLAERFAVSDETAWCSSCINWTMEQAGYVGTNSARARSWLDWGLELSHPVEGAITVIQNRGNHRFHVALFISWLPELKETPTHINLLGGNQSNQVRYSKYALANWDVRGFRLPVLRAAS